MKLRVALVLAFTAACATDDSWKHEIEARHAEMVRLVEQGRNVETLPWYAQDAILLPPGGGMVRGRDAIREMMTG
ncbi:MAG: DUF4440 domain-containing protein, partial [Planctomycetota bacterium]|nr:DUF4440 domain-containing protein [Planctomycetota bacterium]